LTGELCLSSGLLLNADLSGVGKVQEILPVRTLLEVLAADASAQPRTRDLGLQQTDNAAILTTKVAR